MGAEPAPGGAAPVFGADLRSLWEGGGQQPGRADDLILKPLNRFDIVSHLKQICFNCLFD